MLPSSLSCGMVSLFLPQERGQPRAQNRIYSSVRAESNYTGKLMQLSYPIHLKLYCFEINYFTLWDSSYLLKDGSDLGRCSM